MPWPTPAEGPIFRDVLPREYTAMARANGVVTAGIVEASGIVEDNQWILDLVRHDRFYSFFVGNLEIGASTFAHDLARFAGDQRFVGIRGYLTGPAEGITLSPAQLASLRDLARRGMTLDIISRADKNPKDQVQALCTAVPDLRIIIDHLGGAKGPPPVDPTWELEIRRLADVCPNLYMKFSSFYDMYAPGDVVFPTPTDLALLQGALRRADDRVRPGPPDLGQQLAGDHAARPPTSIEGCVRSPSLRSTSPRSAPGFAIR